MAPDPELEDVRPSTVVVDVRDRAVELFGKEWRHLDVADVKGFLDASNDDEPLEWEVKGTKLPHPDSLRKTVGGLANRDGGFFILGGERQEGTRTWQLNGVPFDEDEPATWLTQVLRGGIRPAPEIDVRVLWRQGDTAVVIVLVQPILRAPAMVDKKIPERQPGGTVWLEDGAVAVAVVERVVSRSRSRSPGEAQAEASAARTPGPTASPQTLSVGLEPEAFVAALRAQLAEGREPAVEVFLAGALTRVRAAVNQGDASVLGRELDRVVDCAAVALTLRPDGSLLGRALDVLKQSFDSGFRPDVNSADAVGRERLWLEVLARVRALGALAVRLARWGAVRELSLHEVHDGGSRLWPTWLRYGDIHVSRAGLYREGKASLVEGSRRPFRLAAELISTQPSLHPDEVVDEDELITALCQFDFLVNAVAVWEASKSRPEEAAFPYYAAWEPDRVQPIADRLVSDRRLRDAVLPEVSDADLAVLLRFVGTRAARLSEGLGSWMFWDGFEEGRTAAFIAQHLPPDA